MQAAAITAAGVLAILADRMPNQYAAEPERFATIAVAAQRAVETVSPRWWRRGDKLLLSAVLTAAIRESGLHADTHRGERRGKAGEICLMQIHPTNRVWKDIGAPSFESLGGDSLQATTYCLTSGARALARAAGYCLARNYRTNWVQAMWTAYHYGGQCWLSPHAYGRTALMWRLYSCSPEPMEEHEQLVAAVIEGEES